MDWLQASSCQVSSIISLAFLVFSFISDIQTYLPYVSRARRVPNRRRWRSGGLLLSTQARSGLPTTSRPQDWLLKSWSLVTRQTLVGETLCRRISAPIARAGRLREKQRVRIWISFRYVEIKLGTDIKKVLSPPNTDTENFHNIFLLSLRNFGREADYISKKWFPF